MGQLDWLGGVAVVLKLGQVHGGQRLGLVVVLSLRRSLVIILSLRLVIILSLGRCCSLHRGRGRH